MKRAAFVTGATGVVGLNLVEQLLAQGWEVTALVRPTSDLRYLKSFDVRVVVGAIEDHEGLLRVVPAGLNAFFHTAANVSLWSKDSPQQTRTNVDGVRNVVEVCLARGVERLIHTSSMGVYGLRRFPYDESAEKLGGSSWINYFRTKTIGEELIREGITRGLNAVILNPSNIVGPYDSHNWGRIFQLLARGRWLFAPRGRASFCHAVEVANAHIAAVDKGRIGENYLLGGAVASYLQAFKLMATLMPKAHSPMWISRFNFRIYSRLCMVITKLTGKPPDVSPEVAAMFAGNQMIASEKAQRELGYRPATLEKMFEDCYRWQVAAGLLPEKS